MSETQKQEKTSNTKENQMNEVAKVYGISLADIEEIHLPNGKEYFKFYNPQDKTVKMIENRKDGKNLSEQFKEIQQTLSYSQGDNSISNARAVFDYQMRYENIELSLIPVQDLKGNISSYRHLVDSLKPDAKKTVRVLLENIDFLDLTYINIENSVAIDRNNRVIQANYNAQTGKCELKSAEVRSYDTDKKTASDAEYVFDISDEEFDSVIDGIDVSSDVPTIKEGEPVDGIEVKGNQTATIRGREVNMVFAIQAYQYPEIIDRSEMSNYDKKIYHGIIKAISRKMEKRKAMNKEKQYILTQNDNGNNNRSQAAFVDTIFLAILAGFFTGATLLLALSFLRNIF